MLDGDTGHEARMSDVLTEQPQADGTSRGTPGGNARSGRSAPPAPSGATPRRGNTTKAAAAPSTMGAAATPEGQGMAVGDRVEVRRRFDEEWASGFELAEVVADGYRVRRRSDGEVLPAVFATEAVRAERRHRRNMWWY